MSDAVAASRFAAMGHPHRVALMRLLVRMGGEGLNVTAIRQSLQIPLSTLNHHLRILVDAELVSQSREGRDLVSKANFPTIVSLQHFLMEDCCKGAFETNPSP